MAAQRSAAMSLGLRLDFRGSLTTKDLDRHQHQHRRWQRYLPSPSHALHPDPADYRGIGVRCKCTAQAFVDGYSGCTDIDGCTVVWTRRLVNSERCSNHCAPYIAMSGVERTPEQSLLAPFVSWNGRACNSTLVERVFVSAECPLLVNLKSAWSRRRTCWKGARQSEDTSGKVQST